MLCRDDHVVCRSGRRVLQLAGVVGWFRIGHRGRTGGGLPDPGREQDHRDGEWQHEQCDFGADGAHLLGELQACGEQDGQPARHGAAAPQRVPHDHRRGVFADEVDVLGDLSRPGTEAGYQDLGGRGLGRVRRGRSRKADPAHDVVHGPGERAQAAQHRGDRGDHPAAPGDQRGDGRIRHSQAAERQH